MQSCARARWLVHVQRCRLVFKVQRVAVCDVVFQFVTKRRNSWACRGNPNPEQETIKGTHTQETPAYQRRPTTQMWCFKHGTSTSQSHHSVVQHYSTEFAGNLIQTKLFKARVDLGHMACDEKRRKKAGMPILRGT